MKIYENHRQSTNIDKTLLTFSRKSHHFGDLFTQKSSFWRPGLELSDPSNHRFLVLPLTCLDMPSDPPNHRSLSCLFNCLDMPSDPSNHRFLDMPSDPPLSDTWLRHAAGTLNGFEAGRVGWAYQGWDKLGGISE